MCQTYAVVASMLVPDLSTSCEDENLKWNDGCEKSNENLCGIKGLHIPYSSSVAAETLFEVPFFP